MPLLEALVIQDDESVVRLIISPHNLSHVIVSCTSQIFGNHLVVMKLPKNLQITLKNCPPFKISCIHTADISSWSVIQFLEDIEDRITVLLERHKTLSGEVRETLHDYMEKLVHYYQDQTKLIPEHIQTPEFEFEFLSYNQEELERVCNQKLDITKRYRNSSVRSTTSRRAGNLLSLMTAGLRNNNAPSTRKKLCALFMFLIVMGVILMLYECGGYNFQYCRDNKG